MNILLIEDNVGIIDGLKFTFEKNNYNFNYTTNVSDTENYLDKKRPSLIILDITLPDGNGFDLYEKYIKTLNIPVIFLTAKDDSDDIVKGLDLGAEDYITKPFSTKELLARVRKVLMRSFKQSKIKVKDVTFNIDKMIIYKNGKELNMTPLEIKIANQLFLNINKVVKRDELLDLIWRETGNDVDNHTLTVYMKRIREKLGDNIIITIKGIGYRIDENEK